MTSSQKPVPVRVKGQVKCAHHQRKKVKLFCTSCDELICSKCRSSVHTGHDICDLHDIIPDRKTKLQKYIDEFRKYKNTIRKEQTAADKELEENSEMFVKQIKKVKYQGEKMKDVTEELMEKYSHLYQQLQEENVNMMATYKKELQIKLGNLKSYYKECRTLMQEDGSDVLIFDIEKEIQANIKEMPTKPAMNTASSFKVNKYPQADLEKMFGFSKVNEHQQQGQTSNDTDESIQESFDLDLPETDIVTTDLSEPLHSPCDSDLVSSTLSLQYDLLPQCEVVTEFQCPCEISSICPAPGGEVWVCDVLSNTVNLLDPIGQVQHSIEYQSGIRDISMSPNTNNVWTCSDEDFSITEYFQSSGKPVLRFQTKIKPNCLCVTMEEHIIVGMNKNVTKFNTNGEIILTTKPSQSGHVNTPYKITQCSITGNIAMVDLNLLEDGGEDKGCVLIMDKWFNKIIRYQGDSQHQHGESIKTNRFSFSPIDAQYDSTGNLVIGDCLNSQLHLINGSGKLLQLIHTDHMDIWGLGIGSENTLWVVFGQPEGRTHVKVLIFTQMQTL